MARLGASPIVNLHVHYDRPVLDEPFAAAEATSPLQWLFDRTESSEVAEGQLVSVSLSGAAADIGEPLATLRERYVPALERLLPRREERRVLDFSATREPRATFRGAPGTARLRPGTRTTDAEPLPRRRVDGHRLARDDGERRAQRPRSRGGRARRPRARRDAYRESGMSLTTSPRPDAAHRRSPAAASTCAGSSTPTAGGRASSRPT